jgi:hypothetical protein
MSFSPSAAVWIPRSGAAHRASHECRPPGDTGLEKNAAAGAAAVLAEDNSRYGQGKLAMLLQPERSLFWGSGSCSSWAAAGPRAPARALAAAARR